MIQLGHEHLLFFFLYLLKCSEAVSAQVAKQTSLCSLAQVQMEWNVLCQAVCLQKLTTSRGHIGYITGRVSPAENDGIFTQVKPCTEVVFRLPIHQLAPTQPVEASLLATALPWMYLFQFFSSDT